MTIFKKSLVVLVGLFAMGFSMPVWANGGWCKTVQAPQINIKTSTDRISYDFSKSEKELNNFSVDTVNPYGNSVITDVGGLMRGGISVSHSMRYGTLTNQTAQQICYWYTDITISLHINPTIYVANEFPKGSCKHNAILQHEHQHVSIDRDIVNKYAQILGLEVKAEVQKQTVYGPLSLSRKAELENFLANNMKNIVSRVSEQMNVERRQRQQALDNLSEYERVNHLCSK